MRKRIKFRKLSRTPTHKWAMLRNMVTSLIKHERIQTTLPKAKELRYLADKVAGLGKDGSLHARRQADSILREKPALTKLFEIIGPRYVDRDGGYTRILKLSQNRKGDNAKMAIIEYVDRPGEIRAARVPKKRREELLMMMEGAEEEESEGAGKKVKRNLKDVLMSVGIDPVVWDGTKH
mmetsp:Transcript_7539/g.10219  ORF Transcript_7539/g.10219 Transcript_7539/m.10219 type:complete len:179 (-) Transcript_7539:71-607(-)|eukprot:CAMPEP_0185731286 /NCGR_PEP_ID=MMETSP1171-20130828/12436_1 /TAXON_ID=374046 /ORGANISM="Helicotheca tamensis, Strain CCMP826" /LENGTH=178 /DNA_ID=CAMNT_0028400521 /DNA_START=71 /DNA_END=607 /DNA_ORIENTATION=+